LKTFAQAAQEAALDARSIYLRNLIVDALEGGERGHIGSSFSLVEIVRVLYDTVLKGNPDDPTWPDRDRFILSKGHGCLAQYVLLADLGYFSKDELVKFCRYDGILGGHPERGVVPGVEASTGALGHGLAIGVGMALAARIHKKTWRVFVVLGDGELDEGSVWESALAASQHKLTALTAIVDYNKLQSYGAVSDVLNLEPLAEKWQSLGWEVHEVNGHDVDALATLLSSPPTQASPRVLIAHTIKGKGLPIAEGEATWHHKAKVTADDVKLLRQALANA
jgi:transketolase